MTVIRALERDDLHDVARLYALVMRAGSPPLHDELAAFFERTLLDQPWADPELPSLVAVEGTEIVGFVGANVRRIALDGKPMRMVCSAHLIAHPQSRRRGVGGTLLRRLMSGPQDMTITDGATDEVRRMWEALGGRLVPLGAFSFARVFRPWTLGTDILSARRGLGPARPVVRSLSLGLDRATDVALRKRLRPQPVDAEVEPLTPALLLEHVDAVSGTPRLRLTYDHTYLAWLFDELSRVEARGTLWAGGVPRGRLWAELVHGPREVAGWYVCHLRAGGVCRVLQLAARQRATETVFAQLSARAHALGAAGLLGRLEPNLAAVVSATGSLVRAGDGRLLVHAGDPALVDAVLTGHALLTRMDGEWW